MSQKSHGRLDDDVGPGQSHEKMLPSHDVFPRVNHSDSSGIGLCSYPSCDVDNQSFCSQPRAASVFRPSSQPISFLKVIECLLHQSEAAFVGLSEFARVALQPQSRNVHGAASSSDLWPCPVPCWRWTGPTCLSPRRRQRRKFLLLRASLVQKIVCVLNWECLGHPIKPPSNACVGAPMSECQFQMICRLERLVDHFMRPGPLTSEALGRCSEKFAAMIACAEELPECREVDLFEFAQQFASELDPYSKPPHNENRDKPTENAESSHQCSFVGSHVDLPKTVSKPVIADRIKWAHSPQFDPLPFFEDTLVRDAFVDPTRVRLPEEQWPHQPRGKVHCSKSELLKLATKWDSKQACKIFRVDEINFDESVGMFAVPKDESFDRLILNPQTVNSRMQSFSHFTKQLAPGSMFSLLWLQENQMLRISADDLAEMYYTFKIPASRAKRNSVGLLFDAHELRNLSCFNSRHHFGKCVVALNALAMGDSWAVEFAQQSHHNVLQFLAGCMLEHQRVAYRKPFPRSLFAEWLSIDDHVGVQILSFNDFKNDRKLRDDDVFARAEHAYKQVGLVQHPKKKQRKVTQGVFLGAEIDGRVGIVSAPRHRIGTLMFITSLIARKGTASPRLLSCILGCWIHVLMYRRPIMSILSHAFADGRGLPQDKVFCLSRATRNELLALTWLGPVCMADLRVSLVPKIYCTDASPSGAGICEVDEHPNVVSELWRHSEQRGYYTSLVNPSAEVLAGLGESFEEPPLPESDASPLDWSIRIPSSLSEGVIFDCIELFRGEGNWSKAHSEAGFKVHGGLDIKGHVVFGDMLDDSIYHQLISLAIRGVIGDWHAGPPCRTYGTLRRPRIRSKYFPAGFNLSDPLTREQTRLAIRTAFLMHLVIASGRFFSVEQPGSSVMFYLDIFKRLIYKGAIITRMCFCAFGSPFKKPSQWLHNKPWMAELEIPCRCACSSEHFTIEGTFTKSSIVDFEQKCKPSSEVVYGRCPQVGEAVAAFSASYPTGLCRRIASGAAQARDDTVGLLRLSEHVRSLARVGEKLDLPGGLLREPLASARAFHEDPEWIEELADALPFKELLRYRFKRSGHINVLECRVHKTWLKHAAKHHPNSRLVALLDSRVTLGATSKGRSSSRALCRVLQGSLGYVIGGCLYPGGLHVPSAKNRSDGPSRNRPVPPQSKEVPRWLTDLRAGRFDRFDKVLLASRFTKNAARWLRMLLLLAGDIEPNPGPAGHTKHSWTPRGPLDLTVGFTTQTSQRMSTCVNEFCSWLLSTLNIVFNDIAWDVTAAPLAVRAYGMHLFSIGAPRYKFVYCVTGVQDVYPHLRPFLSSAWQVDRKWIQYEPGSCRPVISGPIMRAVCSLAIIWDWTSWLGITLLGFLGMLHPAEFIFLLRSDILLPSDTLVDERVLYIHIRQPKTARFARRQHCKVDDLIVLKFIEKVFGSLHASCRLFPYGVSAYRRRWDSIMARLGVPHSLPTRGCTPASLRGSGATHMYLSFDDLGKVQWRGRWAQLKTLEFYIQEVAAQTIVGKLDPLSRARVKTLNDFALPLLQAFIAG